MKPRRFLWAWSMVAAASLPVAGAPLIQSADVFISGKDGYHTYRIPAIEAAPDGSLVAFAAARKYSAADPGFGKQDIDLVYQYIGFPGHCPHFTRLSTGEILLLHRLPLTALHVSRDEGKTWQGPYQIDETPGAYPSTVELKDGTVLVVYYEEGAAGAIRARQFKLKPDGIEFVRTALP